VNALAILAGRNRDVLGMVFQSVQRYAALQQEIGDASPYSPNGIDVLARGPRHEEVLSFLEHMVEAYPGMAQCEAGLALAGMGTASAVGLGRSGRG
jgi:hypothetical protein